ncbi:MAG: LmeA family phospholipid-binding protein [Myxococcota bacterium]
MKRLVLVLVLLGIVGVAAVLGLAVLDGKVRAVAEQKAAVKLEQALPIEGTPTVEIDSFPFVLGVLIDGTVDTLVVRMESLASRGVEVDEAKLTVHGLRLDRDRLLDAQELEVVGIERARIEAWVTAEDISTVAKVPVEIADGVVTVRVRGTTYTGTASISKHAVFLAVEGMPPFIAPLPENELLPCEPDVDIDGDRIHVACEVTELPPAVADVLAQHT